jgi:hypothetical protein
MSNRWFDLEQELLQAKQTQKRSHSSAQDYDVSQMGNSSLLALAQAVEQVRSQHMQKHSTAEQMELLVSMQPPGDMSLFKPGVLPPRLQVFINRELIKKGKRLAEPVTVIATAEQNGWNLKCGDGTIYYARLNNNQLEIHDKPPRPAPPNPGQPNPQADPPPIVAVPVQNIPANPPPQLPTAPKPAVFTKPGTDLLEPGDIQRWQTLDKVTGKGQGAVGVIFAKNRFNQEIVIKGLEEPPYRLLLAQDLFNRILMPSGQSPPTYIPFVRSAKHRVVAINSPEGKEIVTRLGSIMTPVDTGPGGFLRKFDKAKTILLMEKLNIISARDFDQQDSAQTDAAKLQGVRIALQDPNFWRGLGALYFVDQFLGNTDRLETNKWQNVFMEWTSKKVAALDNDAILPVYISSFLNKDKQPPAKIATLPQTWIRALVLGDGKLVAMDENNKTSVREKLYPDAAFQDKAIANLSAICGPVQQFQARMHRQAIEGAYQGMVDNCQESLRKPNPSPNTTAILTTLQSLNKENMKKMFFEGAFLARQTILNLTLENFSQIFKQIDTTSPITLYKRDLMFDWLAFEIRYQYLRRTSNYPANVVKWETPGGWVDEDIIKQLLQTYNSSILNSAVEVEVIFDVGADKPITTITKEAMPVNKK